jgi:hypothetical protein
VLLGTKRVIEHCVAKIYETVERGEPDRRSVLQLGYNLGRLSELTGLGRDPFWDRWKPPVESWDLPELHRLVEQMRAESASWHAVGSDHQQQSADS